MRHVAIWSIFLLALPTQTQTRSPMRPRACPKRTMMHIQTGKFMAAIIGPDVLSTCLRRFLELLAVLPRVGIMAPRQGSPKPRFGCSLHKAVVHHAKAAKRLRRGARRMQSKSAISANLRWSTSGRPWHSARCRTFEGRFRHEQISARYLDHSA